MSDFLIAPGYSQPQHGGSHRFATPTFDEMTGRVRNKRDGTRKSKAVYRQTYRARRKQDRLNNIAVLDFETDPFNKNNPDEIIKPFLAVLYTETLAPVVIWDENEESFYTSVLNAIENLPGRYVVYAHNGGKFDYMFFIHRLRGLVKFKGRGIMTCKVGEHELRDSFHILPEGLAGWKKEKFDYDMLHKSKRNKHRAEIERYCISDCSNLLDYVKAFVTQFGFKISTGQAAMSELRKSYKFKAISEFRDGALRPYYFGGRVECLAGKGHFTSGHKEPFKLYDVNSMYPAAMANYRHPIGIDYAPRTGQPNEHTAFVNLDCRNYGALVARSENGDTTCEIPRGNFLVSIHEYEMALKLGLIDDIEIHWCIDCDEFTTFEKFIFPLYERRMSCKRWLRENKHLKGSAEYQRVLRDDIFYKLLLNSAYGKFSFNPRKYHEHYICDPGERPPIDHPDIPHAPGDLGGWGLLPKLEAPTHIIWQREARPWRFKNVGTGASITGAARAILMHGICHAVDPIYCDTDSIIARNISDVKIDPVELGAWDIEATYSEVIIAGKKLYAGRDIRFSDFGDRASLKARSKGVNFFDPIAFDDDVRRKAEQERVWREMLGLLREGTQTELRANGITLTKSRSQSYMSRTVRATAPLHSVQNFHERRMLNHG
jgi:hypothetical protein